MPLITVDTSVALPATLSPTGLPLGAPDDYIAVGFAALFDEHERKLREIGHRLDPALADEDVPRLRRQLEAICVAGPPPFDSTSAPALTRDPADDPIVLGALLAGGDLLIAMIVTSCPT